MFTHDAPKFGRRTKVITAIFALANLQIRNTAHVCWWGLSYSTISKRLDEVGSHVPEEDRYFPFRVTFDFETYFSKRNLPEGTDLLQWNAKHVPLSASIAGNVLDQRPDLFLALAPTR